MKTNSVSIRIATLGDLPVIVYMLADDPLGAKREKAEFPLPSSYVDAIEAKGEHLNKELVVAAAGEDIVGALHIPSSLI